MSAGPWSDVGFWASSLVLGGAAVYLYLVQQRHVRELLAACRGGASLDTLERRVRYGGRKGRCAARRLRDARWFDARARKSRRHPSWIWSRDVRPPSSLLVSEVAADVMRVWLGVPFEVPLPLPDWLSHVATGFITAKAVNDGARFAAEAAERRL